MLTSEREALLDSIRRRLVAHFVTRKMSREELDALALREHLAANPTPPSGPPVVIREQASETPAKTTTFHKPDGTPLIQITFGPIKHLRTTLVKRRDG